MDTITHKFKVTIKQGQLYLKEDQHKYNTSSKLLQGDQSCNNIFKTRSVLMKNIFWGNEKKYYMYRVYTILPFKDILSFYIK